MFVSLVILVKKVCLFVKIEKIKNLQFLYTNIKNNLKELYFVQIFVLQLLQTFKIYILNKDVSKSKNGFTRKIPIFLITIFNKDLLLNIDIKLLIFTKN